MFVMILNIKNIVQFDILAWDSAKRVCGGKLLPGSLGWPGTFDKC